MIPAILDTRRYPFSARTWHQGVKRLPRKINLSPPSVRTVWLEMSAARFGFDKSIGIRNGLKNTLLNPWF